MGAKNKEQNKKSKTKSKKRDGNRHEEKRDSERNTIPDLRFSLAHTDPRFGKISKHKSKVAIDSRFDGVLTNKNFAPSSAPVDKRGKPRRQNAGGTSLGHYYRSAEEDKRPAKEKDIVSDEEVDDESESEKLIKSARVDLASESSGESEASESDNDSQRSELESSTDTEEEEEGVVLEEDDTPDVENVAVTEESTRRLAVVNMDWRHVRAVDLYVVLQSFLPKGGEILSVAVYPSEFGLQRLKEEEVHGPVGLFDDKNDKDKEDEDGEDDDEIDTEKLRAYERSRLRYYYAVVECDSVATADHLYKACDGVEFERSSNVLDLRFIPDSMEFKHPPRDVAMEAPSSYDGLDFHTKSLQHSNIAISWDEDEPQRVKTLKRKFNAEQQIELELKEFLASDESETDDDENEVAAEHESDRKHKHRDKYLALIQLGDGSDGEEEEGQDMEITFNTGLEDLSKRILEKKDKKSETVWESYLRERREKKKARKNKPNYSSEEDSSDSDEESLEQPEQQDDFFIDETSVENVTRRGAHSRSEEDERQLEEEASRAELELLLADDSGTANGLKGYNMRPKKPKNKKGKGRKEKELPDVDKVPVAKYDDRFSGLFTSSLYAMDPTDPQYKRSAAYARQVIQKKKKKVVEKELVEQEDNKTPTSQLLSAERETNKDHTNSDVLPSRKEKYELSSLVKSIKMKSKQVQLPTDKKISKKDESLQLGAKQKVKPKLLNLVQSVKKKAKVTHKNE